MAEMEKEMIEPAEIKTSLDDSELLHENIYKIEEHGFQENLNVDGYSDTICNICFAEFLDCQDLQTHVLQVHLTYERLHRFCTFCVIIFPDTEQYLLHVRNEHLAHIHWCKYCFRFYPDEEAKLLHEKNHKRRSTETISCSQCNESFDIKDCFEISQHECQEHEDSNDGFMLNKEFSLLSALLNMNVKTFLRIQSVLESYVCVCCKTSHVSIESYIEHLKKLNCRSFSCDVCYNVFESKKRLSRHIKIHTKQSKLVTCLKCNGEYSAGEFIVHKKTCSTIKCFECGMVFQSVPELGNHKAQAHKEIVTFNRCKFCDKHVIGSEMMKKHLKISHKGKLHLYKYVCVYCDKIFMHPKNLFGHFFSTHKDLQPFSCKICDLSFRIRKKFTLHVRITHNGKGFIEFDDKFNVFFSDKKSENPFVPQSIYKDSSDDENDEQDTKTKSVSDSNTKINMNGKDKIKQTRIKRKVVDITDSSDSDVPLLKVRKTAPKHPLKFGVKKRNIKHKFMCVTCKKNCYTAQNFKHHMNLHAKKQPVSCIKCDKSFKSEKALKKHMNEDHSKSVLIDTLQKVKERRKENIPVVKKSKPISKFMKTLKKVEVMPDETSAKITVIKSNEKLSARNFLEKFTSDLNSEKVKIQNAVTIKCTNKVKDPIILMKKCNLEPMKYDDKSLKMPTKFVHSDNDSTQVTVKLVTEHERRVPLNFGEKILKQAEVASMEEDHAYFEESRYDNENDNNCDDTYHTDDEKNYIPEVAEEVSLSTEEYTPMSQQFILPDIPEAMKAIRIGTLQPQAPFFKIIPVEQLITESEQKKGTPTKKVVELPDGMQLVSVNPLAHLIKDEDIKTKLTVKKYYKPKDRDIREAILKSMAVRKKQHVPKNKRKSKIDSNNINKSKTDLMSACQNDGQITILEIEDPKDGELTE